MWLIYVLEWIRNIVVVLDIEINLNFIDVMVGECCELFMVGLNVGRKYLLWVIVFFMDYVYVILDMIKNEIFR